MSVTALHKNPYAAHWRQAHLEEDPLRVRALAKVEALGLPDNTQEAWRYLPLKELREGIFAPHALAGHNLAAMAEGGALHALESSPHALDALAFAFTDTIHTHTITQDTTLHLDHVGEDAPTAQHHVVLIDVQPGATLTLIENISGEGAHWLNIASRLHIAKGARVEHILLQNASRAATLTTTQIVDVEGEYSQTLLALGGSVARHECHVHLRERHASATLTGAYLGKEGQVLDHYLPITHHAQNCESKQAYKGVLDDRARGIFYGKIIVPPGASGTVAHQQSRAMLLSPQAEADNRPELEILNDDVVCSHGAAIGSLDPEMLYYLQARGLPEAQARALLIHAFVAELFDAENPLHQPLLEAI